MRTQHIIIGLSNPYGGESGTIEPLSPHVPGSAGARLFQIAGVELEAYERTFKRDNLFLYAAHPNNFAQRVRDAVRTVRRNIDSEADHVRVIALGREVGDALGLSTTPWFRWIPLTFESILASNPNQVISGAVMPHPSGLNRLYNDNLMVEQARGFLRRAVLTHEQENEQGA